MEIVNEKLNQIVISRLVNFDSVASDAEFANFFSRSIMETRLPEVGLQVNPSVILQILDEHINSQEKIVLAAKDGSRCVGILIGSALNYPFTVNKMITDVLFRVDPDYRGHGIGSRLLKSFAEWGKSKGAMLMMVGINEHVGREAKESTTAMDRMGFKIFNYNYAARI